MKKPQSQARPLPHIRGRRLFVSTPEQQEREHRKAEELTQYRRTYWQNYKKKVRRVFGSLKPSEFEYWSFMAKEHERSVWGQIYACACAYVQNLTLAPKDILVSQKDLLVEIRRIGNNINQAVRLGHIKANKQGCLYADPGDEIGQALLTYMQDLERRVTLFQSDVTSQIKSTPVRPQTANSSK